MVIILKVPFWTIKRHIDNSIWKAIYADLAQFTLKGHLRWKFYAGKKMKFFIKDFFSKRD